ncbi:ATP-dependent RNA helicase RhlE [BD1-7 clade bacterium]|nr:ATP-dependent RNA helicase RhlE [BD1-7 clade bacterium]
MTTPAAENVAQTTFADLKLAPKIQENIANKGYKTPSPIQARAIPAILEGNDLLAAAQTGTGKTAAFVLPLIDQLTTLPKPKPNACYSLIVTPTRELAAQIYDNICTYGNQTGVYANVVYGGVKINPQMKSLRGGTHILVATPGRLLDLYRQNAIHFDDIKTLVLDEADRMLDMGFLRDIREILRLMPKERQNLLFSATFSGDIRTLAKSLLNAPIEIDIAPRNTTAETVEQWIYPVDKRRKAALLTHLIKTENWHQAIVFCRTKHGANKLATLLNKANITAAAIHGNKSQAQRIRALKEFKQGKIQILVATDIAARGIDIPLLPHVANFDLPHVSEDYVHRIGRTGRAEANGQAVSLVCADEHEQLTGIERLLQRHLERRIVKGFEPEEPLANSIDKSRLKPHKPKKPKSSKSHGGQDSNRSGGKRHNDRRSAGSQKSASQKAGSQKSGGQKSGNQSSGNRKPANSSSSPSANGNTAAPKSGAQNPWNKS